MIGRTPDAIMIDAAIDEQHMRVFGRPAHRWEIIFFRRAWLGGNIDFEGIHEILMRDPESFGKDHQAWPMPLHGWN